MTDSHPEKQLSEYMSRDRQIYENFAECIAALVKTTLDQESIQYHSVTSRSKDPDKLQEKLTRPGKRYEHLQEVTDLAGVRVITYFADDVDRAALVIEREFIVDPERSIDKRHDVDEDRFGYRALHKICSLTEVRASLPEYSGYTGLVCETQICSILQHAWAETEHDLRYKSSTSLPRQLRRRFSKLAALLETADDELERLRDDIDRYKQEVGTEIKAFPDRVEINSISIDVFLKTNKVVRDVEAKIMRECQIEITDEHPLHTASMARVALHLGIRDFAQLTQLVIANQKDIVKYADYLFSETGVSASRGISIYLLLQILAAKLPKRKDTANALNKMRLFRAYDVADELRALFSAS